MNPAPPVMRTCAPESATPTSYAAVGTVATEGCPQIHGEEGGMEISGGTNNTLKVVWSSSDLESSILPVKEAWKVDAEVRYGVRSRWRCRVSDWFAAVTVTTKVAG